MRQMLHGLTGLMASALLFGLLVPGGLCHEALTTEEKAFLENKREIVFVSQTVYPPFEFVEKPGDHTGMCIELARWIATEFGFKARFTDTVFKEAQQAVLSGKADVLTSLFYSEKRDQVFDFTDTMFEVPASIFVAADRPDIKGIENLNGKTIAMQKGDYALEFLHSKGLSFAVVDTANFAEATDLVIAGRADAIIGDEQIVLYHVYSKGMIHHIKKVGEPLYIGQNCMAVKEGNPILHSILNKGVAKARKSGVLDRIQRKWLGVQMTLGQSFLERHKFHIVLLFAGLCAMVFMIWIWNLQLRRRVATRTDELARSEAALRTVLTASPIGIGVLAGKEMDWHNESMTRITGYGPEELRGRPPKMLFADEQTADRADFEIMDMVRRYGSASLETLWRRKDGSVFDCLMRYAPIGGREGEDRFVVLAEDISARNLIQKQLRENEAFLRTLVENIPNMVFVKDAKTLCFVQLNMAGEQLLGYKEEELLGKSDYDFFPKEDADFFTVKDRQVLLNGSLVDIPEETIQTKHKGVRVLHTKKIPLLDKDGSPAYLLGISEDITDRLKEEAARKASEEHLRAAIDAIDEGFAIYDLEDRLSVFNAKYPEMYKELHDLLTPGARFEDLVRQGIARGQYTDAVGRENEWLAERMAHHRRAASSVEQKLKDGRWVKISERKTQNGSTVGVHVDVTAIKMSQKRAQEALKEKEILLREIHHRVKNNLQVVSSLLSLQSAKANKPELTEAFLDAQRRVQSMAFVHQVLYRSDNFREIELQPYLQRLVNHVFQSFASQSDRVNIGCNAGRTTIGLDQAVPFGLIVNELLTNSLKHAFPDGHGGSIRVEVLQDGEDIVLTMADNGIGLPLDFNPAAGDSLGLQLVIELVEEQLEGTWEVSGQRGAAWVIRWPISK